jgi:hypothetical protein
MTSSIAAALVKKTLTTLKHAKQDVTYYFIYNYLNIVTYDKISKLYPRRNT